METFSLGRPIDNGEILCPCADASQSVGRYDVHQSGSDSGLVARTDFKSDGPGLILGMVG